jgi:hypothetical protein
MSEYPQVRTKRLADPAAVGRIASGKTMVEALPLRIVNLARTYSIQALETLVEIMQSPQTPAAVRIKCVEIILDRGYGKAHQSVSVHDNTADKTGLAAIPILERVKAILEARTVGGTTTDVTVTEVMPVEKNVTPSRQDDGGDLV